MPIVARLETSVVRCWTLAGWAGFLEAGGFERLGPTFGRPRASSAGNRALAKGDRSYGELRCHPADGPAARGRFVERKRAGGCRIATLIRRSGPAVHSRTARKGSIALRM